MMVRVLMICMGNICRSPMAEGVLRQMVCASNLSDRVYVESAGTHSYHVGLAPDERSQRAASRRGVDLQSIRARRVIPEDLDSFDYLLVMDRENYRELLSLCWKPEHRKKITLFMEYARELSEREIPDPSYGGASGFERVLDLIEEASQGLLAHIRAKHSL